MCICSRTSVEADRSRTTDCADEPSEEHGHRNGQHKFYAIRYQ